MPSAWRSAAAAALGLAACAALAIAASAGGQDPRRGGRRGWNAPDLADAKVPYDGRFAFARLRYGGLAGGFRREPPWAHDYPRADWHFQRILEEVSLARTLRDRSNIFALDDPDLFQSPIAYMSEPGFWTMSDGEAAALGAWVRKGGFLIFDDFRDGHWENLEAQMRRVLPDLRWQVLDAGHPIFHAFFEIDALPEEGYYGPATWLGLFEGNDSARRLVAVANHNHDLGEFWEFSDQGFMPVDLSNEAYKFGVNYVIYAMTH